MRIQASVAVTDGNPEQASYVLSSRFLDGLAKWRRSCGMVAFSIKRGAVSDVGMSSDGDLLGLFAARGNLRVPQ